MQVIGSSPAVGSSYSMISGIQYQCTCYTDALTLPARKFRRHLVDGMKQADGIQHGFHSAIYFFPGNVLLVTNQRNSRSFCAQSCCHKARYFEMKSRCGVRNSCKFTVGELELISFPKTVTSPSSGFVSQI